MTGVVHGEPSLDAEPSIPDELTPPAGLNVLERHLWLVDRLRERGIDHTQHREEDWPFVLRGLTPPARTTVEPGGAGSQDPASRLEPESAVRAVPFLEFVALDEAAAEPLIGTPDEAILPAGGDLMVYGTGGAGKTTLAVDMAAHLASGTPWLGFPISGPVKVMILEAEGPRPMFRRKLRRKASGWSGAPFAERVTVVDEPWARVTFATDRHLIGLAAAIDEHQVDVLVAGPVRRLGLKGGGTPEEVVAFGLLLTGLRRLLTRPLAIILVHHENKGGDVSGAFPAEPDTLLHLTSAGKHRSTLIIKKARWASRAHDASLTLAWEIDSESFTVVGSTLSDAASKRDSEAHQAREWILEYVTEHPGSSRGKVEMAFHDAHEGGRTTARRVIDKLLAELDAWHAGGEDSGEEKPLLATTTGERKNGIYLKPFTDATSPLAAPLFGEGGEQGAEPSSTGSARRSPPPIEIGGERRADGEGGESGHLEEPAIPWQD